MTLKFPSFFTQNFRTLERYCTSHIIYFYVVFMVLFEAWQPLVAISFHIKTSFVFQNERKKDLKSRKGNMDDAIFIFDWTNKVSSRLSKLLTKCRIFLDSSFFGPAQIRSGHPVQRSLGSGKPPRERSLQTHAGRWDEHPGQPLEGWLEVRGGLFLWGMVYVYSALSCAVFSTGSCVRWWSRWSWAQICPVISSRSRRWGTRCSSRRGECGSLRVCEHEAVNEWLWWSVCLMETCHISCVVPFRTGWHCMTYVLCDEINASRLQTFLFIYLYVISFVLFLLPLSSEQNQSTQLINQAHTIINKNNYTILPGKKAQDVWGHVFSVFCTSDASFWWKKSVALSAEITGLYFKTLDFTWHFKCIFKLMSACLIFT